ncbi:MAG: hypothetical protein ABIH37_02655 [archaeon]
MNNKIFLFAAVGLLVLVGLIGASFIEKEYVLIGIHYESNVEGESFTRISRDLIQGYYPTLNQDLNKDYRVNLLSDDESIIYTNSFDPTQLYSDGVNEGDELDGGIIKMENVDFYLVVPSNRNGDKVRILDSENNLVFEEEVYDVGKKECRVR